MCFPNSYYQSRTVGEVTSRITDLSSVRSTFGNLFLSFVIDFVLLLFSFFFLFYLEPLLTIMIVTFVLLEFVAFFLFRKKLSIKLRLVKEKYACVMSKVFDTLNNIYSIRFVRREEYTLKKTMDEYREFLDENLKYQRINQVNELLVGTIQTCSEILVFLLGVVLIGKGKITLSSFMSYYFLLSFFFEPINHFFSFVYDYMDSKESLFRMEELYEVEEEKVGKAFLGPIEKVILQDITFSYRMDLVMI